MKTTKKTLFLRRIVIGAIIASFAYISIIFVYQFLEYQKTKERLNLAYASSHSQTSALYRIFSVYGEAENLFSLYTLDFDKKNYEAYKTKIDTIKYYIDSLSALPIENNPLLAELPTFQQRDYLINEFAMLKKTVGDLVFLAEDSLANFDPEVISFTNQPYRQESDSVLSKILNDTSFTQVSMDTIVHKKQNLFNRIFKAKNDTLTNTQSKETLSYAQMDVIQRNIESLITQNNRFHRNSMGRLKNNFEKMRQKERELIQSNHRLLNALKTGIENLRDLENLTIRKAEQQDLDLYKVNANRFGNQLIITLCISLLMLLLLLYYQRNAQSYEERLQKEKEYAARVAQEKTSILANISHEVRSPIQSLMGVIEILNKSDGKDMLNKEYLDSAKHEIAVINSSVTDILNLSKLEAGALEVKFEFVPIHQLLQETLSLHTYQAERSGLALTHKINIETDLAIYSSGFRIKQIVSNLVSNAIKYTKQGTVELRASMRPINGSEHLLIEVSDSGVGISADDQKQVFRQYYMADNKTKTGGFGLGLYISKLLAEQLEGDLTVKSDLGEGSTFSLIVPVTKKRKELKPQVRYETSDLPNYLNLVIIDDNRINILYLSYYFQHLPGLRTFEKGAEALAYISKNPVDIVITDMAMPDINGWEILKAIREDKEKKDVEVFVFTAESMLLDQKEQPHYTFDAILTKPLDEHELVSQILAKRDKGASV